MNWFVNTKIFQNYQSLQINKISQSTDWNRQQVPGEIVGIYKTAKKVKVTLTLLKRQSEEEG